MASNFLLALLVYQENHEEAQEELPKKVKFFFSAAVQNWDAEFYIKVDDNIDLDLGKNTSSFNFLSLEVMSGLILHQQLMLNYLGSNPTSTIIFV